MPGRDPVAGLDGDRERGLVRRLVLGRHQVQAELVAALGRQREADQPAPLLGHEVDRLGRRELGGERQIALVLAVLVVADDDHPARADLVQRLFDRCERSTHRNELLHVLGEHIHLQIDGPAGFGRAQRRALQGLGDQGHGERDVVDRRDGQRDAVDRDRALLDDVAQQFGRGVEGDDPGEAVLAGRAHHRHAVDVALDEVTAETIGGAQRQLEVHVRALADLGQRGAPQRLVHDVGGERAVDDLRRGQADAVDGHRVAELQLVGKRSLYVQTHAVRRGVDGSDRSQVGDEPGEHAHHSRMRAVISTSSLDALALERERAHRGGDPFGALALERVAGARATEHDGRQEQADLVDLAGVQERAREVRAALEQDRGHADRAELDERVAHAVGLVGAGGHDHVGAADLQRVDRGARGGAGDDDGQRHLVGAAHELGVQRQAGLGVEDDPARLAHDALDPRGELRDRRSARCRSRPRRRRPRRASGARAAASPRPRSTSSRRCGSRPCRRASSRT